MQKYLITNPDKFTGTAEILYNTDKVLCAIDCTDTNMDAETIKAFKRAVPVTIAELEASGNFSPGTIVAIADYKVPFIVFWNAYKKKVNKQRVILLWESLSNAETIAALEGIKKYDKFLATVKVRQKLDPENYIKLKSWENEWQ